MNSLVNLIAMIGVEKTLIIACGDCVLNRYIEFSGRIFIYFLPESTLKQNDPLEKRRIRYYIKSKECKQVVFVGAIEQNLIDRILQDDSVQSLHSALKFNLSVFFGNLDKAIIPVVLRDQWLTELHVIAQCSLLMDYRFIRERVENRQLEIRGIVTGMQEEQFKPIFYNGIIYNDITSMN